MKFRGATDISSCRRRRSGLTAIVSWAVSLLVMAVRQATSADTPASTPQQPPAQYSYTNHLFREKSPYLLQHAHNPVNWYPWGGEAFGRARAELKPIFLSVGYSTCHWCHVMERESFENLEIAKLLNDNFVCVKVDREGAARCRPGLHDLCPGHNRQRRLAHDRLADANLKPFLGGTYFPPEKLKQALNQVTEAWRKDRDKVVASSDLIALKLAKLSETDRAGSGRLNGSLLNECYAQFKSSYEPRYGGFGDAPKFPRPVAFNFLLHYYARTGKADALEMCLHTLRKMADGGIHDQLGGGFHRYSTDTRWQVPHFEKMLYDQAQLVGSYLDAFQITHEVTFAEAVRDILGYVQRDMTGEQGQFYSAEDADSPIPANPTILAEGAFYAWDKKEIENTLGKEAAAVFCYYYGVESKGNIESDSRGELSAKNVLIVSREPGGHRGKIQSQRTGSKPPAPDQPSETL